MTTNRIALVLGATGGIGGEVAKRLVERGWRVRALVRNPAAVPPGRRLEGLQWLQGDAMSAADVARAAAGASVIVHAVNPPGYRGWRQLVLPMLDNTIAAASANGARIVLPGTVYNFGPDAGYDVDEDAPQNPKTVKGRIRAEMERRLRIAASGRCQVVIVRAGDFFGPAATSNCWFSSIVTPGQPVSAVTSPGTPGVGHQWAYLPDVAETMVQLLERPDALDDFAVFHMEGHFDADGTQMIAAIRRQAGNPDTRVKALPWTLIRLLSPFVPLFGELTEMRYLWKVPLRMTNRRLVNTLGTEPHTPLDVAVRATLVGLGCVAADAAPARAAQLAAT